MGYDASASVLKATQQKCEQMPLRMRHRCGGQRHCPSLSPSGVLPCTVTSSFYTKVSLTRLNTLQNGAADNWLLHPKLLEKSLRAGDSREPHLTS